MASSQQEGPASQLVAEMRREYGACLRFAQGNTAATDNVDAHVRSFLEAAKKLQNEFDRGAQEAADAGAGDREVAELTAEVAALRAELHEKETLLAKHRGRLQEWQEVCSSLELSGPLLLPTLDKAAPESEAAPGAMDTS